MSKEQREKIAEQFDKALEVLDEGGRQYLLGLGDGLALAASRKGEENDSGDDDERAEEEEL